MGTLRWSRETLVLAVVTVLVTGLVAVGVWYSRSGDEPSTVLAPSPDRTVTVNGHALFITCQGSGSPTVILDAGLGESHLVWRRLRNVSENSVRTCAYDRWGVGASAANDGSRPLSDATADLHALLGAAGIRPPYVLVGHSIAGLIGRHFTKLYPTEVAGLVLLDSAPDDWDLYNRKSDFISSGESFNIAGVTASLRESDPLGNRPLVVVRAVRTTEISTAPDFPEYWQAAQRGLARLSSNVVAVAADSNHAIATTQPRLVAAAISLVVDAVKSDGRLPTCAASSLSTLGGSC